MTALSSMVAGTTGFIPPEQMLNKNLTEASDLYGLGATLICLLTGKKFIELGELVDHSFRIDYKSLVSRYSLRFIDWLDLMVEPDVKKRFKNAETALKVLHPLDLIRVPKLKLDQSKLEFNAQKIGEKLTQVITVINETPETVLEGKWSVSPHRSDPPHNPDEHSWIQITHQQFKGNQVQCLVIVDTNKLRANKDYEREIILSSNAEQENHYLKVKVKTAAPIVEAFKKPPYLWLAGICVITAIIGAIDDMNVGLIDGDANVFGAIVGAIVFGLIDGGSGVIFSGMIFGGVIGGGAIGGGAIGIGAIFIFAIVVSTIGSAIFKILDEFKDRGFNKGVTLLYILLSGGLGISIGIAKIIGLSPYIILALAATGLPLAGMLIYPPLRQRILTAQYYRHEAQNLIEP